MLSIIAIGRSQFLYNTIKLLLQNDYPVKGIITAPASPEYSKKERDFRELAESLKLPIIITRSLSDERIAEICKDVDIAVSINWVSLVKKEHINWFKIGILNAHLGDLPKYRGNACPNWAILNGEKEIVLSIHLMEGGKLDCGRVIVQKKMAADNDTYISDIYEWAESVIPTAYLKAIRILEDNLDYSLKYADVDDIESFRCYPRAPADGYIDWNKPGIEIERLIRASGPPFEGAYTFHESDGKLEKLYVLKAKLVEKNSKDLAVPGQILKNDSVTGESYIRCGNDVLSLIECRYADEIESFRPGQRWKSIRMRLGVRAEDWLWKVMQGRW